MKTKIQYSMMDAIFKAKLFLESRHSEVSKPKWLYTRPLHSHNDERNTVEVYILEGSPPLGYIIASYAARTIKVLDENLSSLITYNS